MGSRKYRQNVEKELTCIHCEEKFIGHYNRKRCDPCKEIFTVSVRASKHEKEYYADLEKSRKELGIATTGTSTGTIPQRRKPTRKTT